MFACTGMNKRLPQGHVQDKLIVLLLVRMMGKSTDHCERTLSSASDEDVCNWFGSQFLSFLNNGLDRLVLDKCVNSVADCF